MICKTVHVSTREDSESDSKTHSESDEFANNNSLYIY